MKKLSQLLNLRKVGGRFGVEVEVEGDNLVYPPPDGWKSVADGSLRGAYPQGAGEYVFRGPQSYENTIKLIRNLRKAMDECGARLNFSFRTSVHVHVNMQDYNWNEYTSFLYTSLLLENILVHFCGDVREGNRFCLRVKDAEGYVDTLLKIFTQGPDYIQHIRANNIRYSAINVASTPKYGSVEFRTMRGTLDVEVLSKWISALNNIYEFCFNKTPKKIHDLFVNNHPEDFVKLILKEVANDFKYEGFVEDIRSSFSLTLELPYAFINGEVFHRKQEEREELLKRQQAEQARRLVAAMAEDAPQIVRGRNAFNQVADEFVEFNPEVNIPRGDRR